MSTAEEFMLSRLAFRENNNSIRKLSSLVLPIDFSSNDYLGFSRCPAFILSIENALKNFPNYKTGSGGSRLLSGNHPFTEDTEAFIANFHNADAGLIFNSGYDANVGLLSSVPQRGDTIITDELIHASLIDGARLSHASRYTFTHNDLTHLEAKLKVAKGAIFVVVESVYSMDGDIAPLKEISKLCDAYNANLIVDEAHAIGIFGDHGKGLVQALQLEDKVLARIVTFGKALGCHGAIILGSNALRSYLINFARSFIYTTAAPIHNIVSVKCAYTRLLETNYSSLIEKKIALYQTAIEGTEQVDLIERYSTIKTIRFKNNNDAKSAAGMLQYSGYDVRAILSPTVPVGSERLRICLHLFNTDEEILGLVDEIKLLQ
ncbi:MAG: pyridoxal phosphate-dependent aminotransferase family protein [Bacteroidota bacterium]